MYLTHVAYIYLMRAISTLGAQRGSICLHVIPAGRDIPYTGLAYSHWVAVRLCNFENWGTSSLPFSPNGMRQEENRLSCSEIPAVGGGLILLSSADLTLLSVSLDLA